MVDWSGFSAVDLGEGTGAFSFLIDVISCDLCASSATEPTVTLNIFSAGSSSYASMVLNGLGRHSFSSAALVGSADITAIDGIKFTINGTAIGNLDLAIETVETVPEPGTILLFGSGLMGLAAWRMVRK